MRGTGILVLAAWTAAAVWGNPACHAFGIPPTTDPQALRLLVQQARALRPAEVTVNFEVRLDDGASTGASQRWVLGWGPSGVRVGTFASESDPFPGAETGWQFSTETGEAMRWGPGGAKTSRDPASLQVGELPTEYEFFLGQFVMEDALGNPVQRRDAMALLAEPTTVILPETQVVSGEECVVVLYEAKDPSGALNYAMRGYYGISRGFAQVQFEFVRGDGSLMDRWNASKFQDLVPGAPALPVEGTYESWDAPGHLASILRVTVVAPPDGSPAIVPSLHLQAASALGGGARILEDGSGIAEQLAADHAAPTKAFVAATPDIRPTGTWLTYGGLSFALVGLGCVFLGRFLGRRAAHH